MFVKRNRLLTFRYLVLYLVNISIYYCNGSDVHHIAHGALEVCEMDRFVKSHLYRTDDFRFGIQSLK